MQPYSIRQKLTGWGSSKSRIKEARAKREARRENEITEEKVTKVTILGWWARWYSRGSRSKTVYNIVSKGKTLEGLKEGRNTRWNIYKEDA